MDTNETDDLKELVDPSALIAPEPVELTRVFTDPMQPTVKVTLTLQAVADHFFSQRVEKLASGWIRDFVTGRPDPNRPGKNKLPAPIVLTAGPSRVPVEDMFTYIAALKLLQVLPQGQAAWDVHKWALVAMRMPTAIGEMALFANEVNLRALGQWREMDADGNAEPQETVGPNA